MKKEILILCKTDLERDPRVLKQIEALQEEYNLTCVGVSESKKKGVNDLPLFDLDGRENSTNRIVELTKLITKQYRSLYWSENNTAVLKALYEYNFDLIICNETESLPIADSLADKNAIPIYCDLHEFYLDDKQTGSFSKAQQKYEEWILIAHIQHVKKFTTVSPQIIELYKDRYNLDCDLLDNACKYYNLSSSPTLDKSIKVVSHGAAIPARRLEIMIEAITELGDTFTLDLFLMNNNPTYRQHLINLANSISNVNILDSIPFESIQSTINRYDVGLYLLFPTHLNNKYALPNKLFEFIQGRVAIVIGPTPAMADIVSGYQIGEVAKDFTKEALVTSLKSLTVEKLNFYKNNTDKAAKELNSQNNLDRIKKIVKDLIY